MTTTTYTVTIDTDYSALGEGGTQEMLDGYAENLATKLSADFGVSVEVEQQLGARGQCVGPDDDIAAQIYQAVRDIQGSDGWVDLLPATGTMASRTDRNGIELDDRGTVAEVACPVFHTGNTDLHPDLENSYKCGSCGEYFTPDQVREMIRARRAEKGASHLT